jgi:hypothetical protein
VRWTMCCGLTFFTDQTSEETGIIMMPARRVHA